MSPAKCKKFGGRTFSNNSVTISWWYVVIGRSINRYRAVFASQVRIKQSFKAGGLESLVAQ